MRRYRGPNGDPRIWFQEGEIDAVMDAELACAGLVPTVDDPVTDLERFVEGHLGTSLDQYAELPVDVLGVTEFRPHGRHAISVNRSLTESAVDAEDAAPGCMAAGARPLRMRRPTSCSIGCCSRLISGRGLCSPSCQRPASS